MSQDESSPEPSDIREPSSAVETFPRAWQPLTPRGVAAFSRARIGRLLIVQCIAALLVAGSALWFLSANWFPTAREAIRALPETGLIQNQQLSSPRTVIDPLSDSRFLTFVVDVDGAGTPSLATDLRVEFHRRNIAVCSLFGCLLFDYPKDWTIQFNRPELDSWWAAWEPTLYTVFGAGVVVGLLVTWWMLAAVYCPVVRIYCFFKDRQITLLGSWKLSAAALLPAALFTAAAIVLYGLGLIDLVRLIILWCLHLPLGWAYLFAGPLALPKASDALPPARKNPFGDPPPPAAPNPFSASDAEPRAKE